MSSDPRLKAAVAHWGPRFVANGVVLIRAGLYSNCIRFMPPLMIGEDELREALGVVGAAIKHVEEHGP